MMLGCFRKDWVLVSWSCQLTSIPKVLGLEVVPELETWLSSRTLEPFLSFFFFLSFSFLSFFLRLTKLCFKNSDSVPGI